MSSGARVSAEVSPGLTSRPFPSSPVFHRSVRRRSLPPAAPPPSLVHCPSVIWQTKRLFIRRRDKKKKVLPSRRSHCGCQALPRPQPGENKRRRKRSGGLSALLSAISEGRELLTPDQRGYHGKHGRRPDPAAQAASVRETECDFCHERAHCGRASAPN